MLNLKQRYWDWKKEKESISLKNFLLGYVVCPLINYRTSAHATKLFIDCINSGVKRVKCDHYHVRAQFNNGYSVDYWCANKMYAYASDAVFTTDTREKIGFKNQMPKRYALFHILENIENKARFRKENP